MTASNLDRRIRHRFQLFQGHRSESEDEKLYAGIYDRLFSEILIFLEDNLDPKTETALTELINSSTASPNSILGELFRYLAHIPDVAYRLESRLDHFINNLYWEMIENKSQPTKG